MKKVVIGITDCSKYPNYEKWILAEPDVEVIRIGHALNNFDQINLCNGIVLTGGEDIHPRLYHHAELLKYCEVKDMDEKRDELEWNVLQYAEEHKVPLLGICRGLQLANVYYGGTLIPDLPSFGKQDHAKIKGVDRYHGVKVKPSSLLESIVGMPEGEVNSAHHQGVDQVGKGLVVNAVSSDGIVEGLEKESTQDSPFFLLVQWHPERMRDAESAFSKRVKAVFLNEVRAAQ